jgi:phospholipase/carboxylesterase
VHAGRSAEIREAVVDPEPDGLRGLAVFLHGWTGDEHSMDVLRSGLAQGWWRISPRAPFSAPPGGFSWTAEHSGANDAQAYKPAANALQAYLQGIGALRGLPLVLIGFSQGSALAFSAVGAGLVRPAGLAVLSGFLPLGVEPSAFVGLRIFWSHGIRDDLVTIDRARADVRRLDLGGSRLTYCEADVGHKVGLPCVRGMRTWLMDLEQNAGA